MPVTEEVAHFMDLFDRLPKTLRRALNDAPYELAVTSVYEAWTRFGCRRTARAIEEATAKALAAAQKERGA